jgi:translation initiation factor 2 subunit 1
MVHYKKKGFPSESDLVICRVKNVLPHCAFVELLEYENKEGMVHISEIASGWVKNIRNYVQDNKQVVCKVIGINQEKGHIDLSLKRVSSGERKATLSVWKMEKRMEMLVEHISNRLKADVSEAYKVMCDPIVKHYGSFASFYTSVGDDGVKGIKSLKIPKKWMDELISTMEDQIKAHRVKIKGRLGLVSNDGDGINRIKKVLLDIPANGVEINIKYLGTPNYKVEILANNYNVAESALSKILFEIESRAKELKVDYKWSR